MTSHKINLIEEKLILCNSEKYDFKNIFVLELEFKIIFKIILILSNNRIKFVEFKIQKVKSWEKIENADNYRGLVKQRK